MVMACAGELLADADAPMADVDAATAAAMQRDLRRVNTRAQRGGPRPPGDPVDHVHLGMRERHRRRRQERAARKAGACQEVPEGLGNGWHRYLRHRHPQRTHIVKAYGFRVWQANYYYLSLARLPCAGQDVPEGLSDGRHRQRRHCHRARMHLKKPRV